MNRFNWPNSAPQKTPLLLVVLALSLNACASRPQLVPVTPALPTPPVLSTPLPQQTYSESVQALFNRWRLRLMATSPTSEPSPGHGPSGTRLQP